MTTLPFKDHLCPQSKPSPVVLLPLPLTETAWLVDFLKPFKFSKVATELDWSWQGIRLNHIMQLIWRTYHTGLRMKICPVSKRLPSLLFKLLQSIWYYCWIIGGVQGLNQFWLVRSKVQWNYWTGPLVQFKVHQIPHWTWPNWTKSSLVTLLPHLSVILASLWRYYLLNYLGCLSWWSHLRFHFHLFCLILCRPKFYISFPGWFLSRNSSSRP